MTFKMNHLFLTKAFPATLELIRFSRKVYCPSLGLGHLNSTTSRWYSFVGVSKQNVRNNVNSCKYISRTFSFSVLQIQEPLLRNRLILSQSSFLQKRDFSVKESIESAISTHTEYFQSLSESTVVEYAQDLVVQLHDKSGLPWWLTIILTTFLVRGVLLFPLALYQHYVIARLENLGKELDGIANNIQFDLSRQLRKRQLSEKEANKKFYIAMRKERTKLIERDNCHPAKAAILAIFQIPLWIIFSAAFRNLVYCLPHNDAFAQVKYLELTVGGVAWFPNLTDSDVFVLPILLGLTNLAIIEVQGMLHKHQPSKIHRFATNIFRGFAVLMIPVSACVPSCLTLYWVSSSMFGLCQNLMVISPRIRKAVGIPPTPSTRDHPYAYLVSKIKGKFGK